MYNIKKISLLLTLLSLFSLIFIISGCEKEVVKWRDLPCADDTIPPAPILDLNLIVKSNFTITLGWTATGDDGYEGTAVFYNLKTFDPIRPIPDWEDAEDVFNLPLPDTAGTAQSFTLIRLSPNKQYGFYMKVLDNEGNISELSNILIVHTPPIYDTVYGQADSLVTGDNPSSICIADIDNNGYDDIIFSNYNSDEVVYYFNQGNRQFSSANRFPVENGATIVIAEDFNKDGYADLAVNTFMPNWAKVYLNYGGGVFDTSLYTGLVDQSYSLCAADFNHDGFPDLAMGSGSFGTSDLPELHISLNNHGNSFTIFGSFVAGDRVREILSGDFNNDGFADLVTCNEFDKNISILLNSNDSLLFQPTVNYPIGGAPYGICLGDFNNDGAIDIAAACYGPTWKIVILTNDGSGGFSQQVDLEVGVNFKKVRCGDFDNDGDIDLIVIGSSYLNRVLYLLNNGQGVFDTKGTIRLPNDYRDIQFIDIENDGDLDIVTIRSDLDKAYILYNQIVP